MKRALVLGATGHIGAHVVRALLARGYMVRATYRNPRYRVVLDGLAVETIQVNIEDPQQLRAVLDGCELVFHCAGYYPRLTDRRDRAIARGLEQVRRVFDEFQRAPQLQRVVYTSSAATISSPTGGIATEEDREPWPLTSWRPLYATVKVAMEHAVTPYVEAGLPVVIVNPSVCIGEYDAHPFSGRLVLLFAKGKVPFYIDHQFNVVYTGDVGLGHILAAEQGRVGDHYLLVGQNLDVRTFAHLVAQQAGVRAPRWVIPHSIMVAASIMGELAAALTRTEPLLSRQAIRFAQRGHRLDGTKAQHELGMSQTPVAEAIRMALGWFQQHGYC